MGLRMFGNSSGNYGAGNPSPSRYTIEKLIHIGGFYISLIKYPDCTNYEGKKILVTTRAPDPAKPLDPHFTIDYNINCGLVARFEPTDKGWKMAEHFARTFR